VLGLAGTLSLHGLAFQSLILGSGNHKPRQPDIQGVSAMRAGFATTPAEELVLVMIADAAKEDVGLADPITSLAPQSQKPSIAILSPDVLVTVDVDSEDRASDDSAPVAPTAGDPAVRALMFGRYTGQISARIERAWNRPGSPVNDPKLSAMRDANNASTAANETFRCRVQIRQDNRGNVQEVLLLKCNGTEVWRHSLVVAINQSSPLPAPPVPTVFTRSVTMTFESRAYLPASAPDQYKPGPKEESQNRVEIRRVVNAPIQPSLD
jgi:hypothetical protein